MTSSEHICGWQNKGLTRQEMAVEAWEFDPEVISLRQDADGLHVQAALAQGMCATLVHKKYIPIRDIAWDATHCLVNVSMAHTLNMCIECFFYNEDHMEISRSVSKYNGLLSMPKNAAYMRLGFFIPISCEGSIHNISFSLEYSNIFDVHIHDKTYIMYLPDNETDYIQGTVSKSHAPYENVMLEDMLQYVHADDIVLDVGANVGNHALCMASAGAKVYAFEPNLSLCNALSLSRMLNGWMNSIVICHTAIGSNRARGNFTAYNPANLGATSIACGPGPVKILPLDSFAFPQRPTILKIDVEGFEADVLRGAGATIAAYRPRIYIESGTAESFRNIHNILSEYNYVLWDVFNATLTYAFVPMEQTTPTQRESRRQYVNCLLVAYTTNAMTAVNKIYRTQQNMYSFIKDRKGAQA